MKRMVLSLLAAVIVMVGLTDCSGRLGKRVGDLEILFENSQILNQETASIATATDKRMAKMEKTLDNLRSLTAQIGDQINFIPPEAMETASANSTSAEPATKPETVATTISKTEVKTTTAEILEDKLAKLTKRVDAYGKRLNAHDGQFSKLRRRLAEVEDEIRPIYLWTAEFPSGKPRKPGGKEELQLPDELKPGLDELAFAINKGHVKLEKEVAGHADPVGSEKDNLELSKRRAQVCIDHLVARLGPDKDVIWQSDTKWKDYFVAVGKGETDRYGNYKYNRRVCFQRLTTSN